MDACVDIFLCILSHICMCASLFFVPLPQVTLECPGNEDTPRVEKLVERILLCSCQSCSKEDDQEGAVMQLSPSESSIDHASLPDAHTHAQRHTHTHTH